MDVAKSNYNAPTNVKVATIIGTGIASGLCVASMMRGQGVRKVHQLEMGISEGIKLCTASTLGGLATGLVVDKPEHRKAKLKDSVNQLIGNTFVPFGSLAVANSMTKKLPKFLQTTIAIGTLIGTTFLGHAIANRVNKKVFKEDSNYQCDIKDFATDFDDIFFGASTVMNNKRLYQLTATMCPLTYMVHGYLTGTRQSDNKTLDKYV